MKLDSTHQNSARYRAPALACILLAVASSCFANDADLKQVRESASAPPKGKDESPRPDYGPLLKSVGERNWTGVEQAFQALEPEVSREALRRLINDSESEESMTSGTTQRFRKNLDEARSDLDQRVRLHLRLLDDDDPQYRSKRKAFEAILAEHLPAIQKEIDRALGVAAAESPPEAKDDLPERLEKAVEGFKPADWLRLVEAFPRPLDDDSIDDLGSRLLAVRDDNNEVLKEETLQFLGDSKRQFGLVDSPIPRRIRSGLLLAKIDHDAAAWSIFPPLHDVLEWDEKAAVAENLNKVAILRQYVFRLSVDHNTLLLTPLEDTLRLLTSGSASGIFNDSAATIALSLLNHYYLSTPTRRQIAERLSKAPSLARAVIDRAARRADESFETADESLDKFVKTKLHSKALDESRNEDLRLFRAKIRDATVSAAIFQLMSQTLLEATTELDQRRAIAEKASRVWLELCGNRFEFYQKDYIEDFIDLENKYYAKWGNESDDLKILLPVARQEAFPVGRLLAAAPSATVASLLSTSAQRNLRIMMVRILSLEATYQPVLELCREAASGSLSEARVMVPHALDSWALPLRNAGRTPEARTRMGDKTAKDFGDFLSALRQIPGLKPDEARCLKSFAEFCVSRRPLSEEDMQSALPLPMVEASEFVMRNFTVEMLKLLAKDRELIGKSKEAAQTALTGDAQDKAEADKARDSATQEIEDTSAEYAALDSLLSKWQTEHPVWVGASLRAEVNFAWAHHQLYFVEKRTLGTKTDVRGYADRMKICLELTKEASELCPRRDERSNTEEECLELLNAWFGIAYRVIAERDTKPVESADQFDQIVSWLSQLPAKESEVVRRKLADSLLRRLMATDDDTVVRPKQHEIYHFVTGAVKVLGDIPEADEFRSLEAGYRELASGIRFCVVPDGSIYRSGSWAESRKQSFPAGRGEFGVWLTILHTDLSRERSGGFRRYVQNQIENPGTALDARTSANYANDMKKRLSEYLEGLFSIVKVEPLPQPKPLLRTLKDGNEHWRETPLYYLILKPADSTPRTRIPPLPMDLNFIDAAGMVVLPFHSDPVDLDPDQKDPGVIPNLKVKQRLLLDSRKTAMGQIELEHTSTGERLPPSMAELYPDLYPEGFQSDGDAQNDEFFIKFNGNKPFALVTRWNTVRMKWNGILSQTEFPFPKGGQSVDAAVTRLVWWPGIEAESEGKPVTGDSYPIQNLPSGTVPWHFALWGAGVIAGMALLAWIASRLPKRKKVSVAAFAYAIPESVTSLRGVHLLRRILVDPTIQFSGSQRVEIEHDIRNLEGQALADGNSQNGADDPAAILRRWIDTARAAQVRSGG